MTIIEMYEKVKSIYTQYEDQYFYIGLRFENKEREIGEECEWSRHNSDREDEREFPQYGTAEYEEMEVLDGTSAWNMDPSLFRSRNYTPGGNFRESELTANYRSKFLADHCYVVAGDKLGRHDDPDDNEILIKDAVVIAKIF